MFHLHPALHVCVSLLVQKAALRLCFTCTLPCTSAFHFWCERRRCTCVSLAPCPSRLCLPARALTLEMTAAPGCPMPEHALHESAPDRSQSAATT